jgi:XTP/dITP diphosphohydrolase
LLARLEGVPQSERTARFRCAIAIAEPGGEVHVVEGTIEGLVATAPRGSGGFGYDPVFYIPETGCTMAELAAEEKNRISHRARAGQEARRLLATFYGRP